VERQQQGIEWKRGRLENLGVFRHMSNGVYQEGGSIVEACIIFGGGEKDGGVESGWESRERAEKRENAPHGRSKSDKR